MNASLLRLYHALVIDRPVVALGLVCVLVVFFAVESRHFRLDASSESIVLENDRALDYYRTSRKVYGSDDFLIVTYTPPGDLWSPASVEQIKRLRDDLARIESVKTVVSMLDVPLVNSPKVSIAELSGEGGTRTLLTPGIDKALAKKELLESPIYRNNLVSPDGRTTALQIFFKEDTTYTRLLNERNRLRARRAGAGLASTEEAARRTAERAFQTYHAAVVKAERQTIEAIRGVLDTYRDHAQVYLGGVRMIIADMMSFIEHDLAVFGVGVLGFLIAALVYFFRALRWVLLPVSCCVISVIVMVGYLGFLDWPVTVISSNFVSLLLITTLSFTIHLIVRYRILNEHVPGRDRAALVFDTVREMAEPCLYTAVTTIVAFGSLMVSDIRPVIDFGWMMAIGITFAFTLNFVYFPAVLVLLKPETVVRRSSDATRSFTMAVAGFTIRNVKPIMAACGVVAVLGGAGIAQLEVENRFIDHFKSTTEIYRGMELIDTTLGGTMPLDFVLDGDVASSAGPDETRDADDPFDDPFGGEEETASLSYWFNGHRLAQIEAIHDYLESLPEIGKVLSLATGLKIFRQLNDGRMPEDYELALLGKAMPDVVKDVLIDPYLSADGAHTRVTMRLVESAPTLKRKEFIERIRTYLVEQQGGVEASVHPTGMAVLYNNLLQSLYTSQIVTLGAVFVSIFLMFVVLFRSVALSVVAIVPNVLAALSVLGFMGWWGIPLDIMTITIAAITVGIAVDDAIHYVHRFQVEFVKHQTYRETILACHGSIGRAMYYTSLTITVGFSILAFSSFIPTIYFGLLTGFAMVVALMSNLTLLAALLLLVKPLGAERTSAGAAGATDARG